MQCRNQSLALIPVGTRPHVVVHRDDTGHLWVEPLFCPACQVGGRGSVHYFLLRRLRPVRKLATSRPSSARSARFAEERDKVVIELPGLVSAIAGKHIGLVPRIVDVEGGPLGPVGQASENGEHCPE